MPASNALHLVPQLTYRDYEHLSIYLLELDALDSLEPIRRALDDERVDEFITNIADVEESFGLNPVHAAPRSTPSTSRSGGQSKKCKKRRRH